MWTISFGPAIASLAWVVASHGPRLGYVAALGVGLLTGLGVLGLTGLVVAYLPVTIERLGFERLGSWLRRWWDEDAL
jgi:hypothetical protein